MNQSKEGIAEAQREKVREEEDGSQGDGETSTAPGASFDEQSLPPQPDRSDERRGAAP